MQCQNKTSEPNKFFFLNIQWPHKIFYIRAKTYVLPKNHLTKKARKLLIDMIYLPKEKKNYLPFLIQEIDT